MVAAGCLPHSGTASSRLEKIKRMESAVRTLLHGLGEDTEREGLRDTPKVRGGMFGRLLHMYFRWHAAMCTCSAGIQTDCFLIAACGEGAAGLHLGLSTGHRQVRCHLKVKGPKTRVLVAPFVTMIMILC